MANPARFLCGGRGLGGLLEQSGFFHFPLGQRLGVCQCFVNRFFAGKGGGEFLADCRADPLEGVNGDELYADIGFRF